MTPRADRPIRIEFTVPQEMWDRIEAARGDIPRAAFIKLALNVYIAGLRGAEANQDKP